MMITQLLFNVVLLQIYWSIHVCQQLFTYKNFDEVIAKITGAIFLPHSVFTQYIACNMGDYPEGVMGYGTFFSGFAQISPASLEKYRVQSIPKPPWLCR